MSQPVEQLYVQEIIDCLHEIESPSEWTKERMPCFSCFRRLEASCRTSNGRVCVSCTLNALKTAASSEDLRLWPIQKFKESLLPDGRLRDRLTVLSRYKDVRKLIQKNPMEEIEAITILIIQNMGHDRAHPLDPAVRQAAYGACLSEGSAILPKLLKIADENTPPDDSFSHLYANILSVAATISSNLPAVVNLLEKAANHPNQEIRKRAASYLGKQKSSRAEILMRRLRNVSMSEDRQFEDPLGFSSKSLTFSKEGLIPFIKSVKTPSMRLIKTEASPTEILVSNLYNLDTLRRLYSRYLHHLFSETDFNVKGKFSLSKLTKTDLVSALAKAFSDAALFNKLLSVIPEDVRKILDMLVWEGGEIDVEKLEKEFRSQIIQKPEKRFFGNPDETIENAYLLFQFRAKSLSAPSGNRFYKYTVYLHEDLRKLFKAVMPSPESYALKAMDSLEEDVFIFQDSDQILRDVRLFLNYIRQGNLKYSKNTDTVLKASVAQMASYCKIKEFYTSGDKELHHIRTRMLIEFFRDVRIDTDNPAVLLKEAFAEFFGKFKPNRFELRKLLYYLRGMYSDYGYPEREEKVKQSLKTLMASLPLLKWISVDNLISYALFIGFFVDIIDRHLAGNMYYCKSARYEQFSDDEDEPISISGDEPVYISPDLYKDAVIIPFIKAMMFWFAGLGLLDIAYRFPENSYIQEKNNPYFSIFDGVRYIRLTRLGAYVVGALDTYDAAVEEDNGVMTLDDTRLIINMEGRNILKTMALEKIADKISDNCYRVSFSSFLKDCVTQKDILQKIGLFKQEIAPHPPQLWQEFLDSIKDKINPLNHQPTLAVYQLKPIKELISLIAKDEILKKYILKAENYHVLIPSQHLNKVKRRLEDFGYFIDNI